MAGEDAVMKPADICSAVVLQAEVATAEPLQCE